MEVCGSVDLNSTIEAINNQNNIYKTDPMFKSVGYAGVVPFSNKCCAKAFYSGPVVVNYIHNGNPVQIVVPAQITGYNYKNAIKTLFEICNEPRVLDLNNLII